MPSEAAEKELEAQVFVEERRFSAA